MRTCNPIALERLRQEDRHESESWLGYSLNDNKQKPKKRTKDNMNTVEGGRRDRGGKIM